MQTALAQTNKDDLLRQLQDKYSLRPQQLYRFNYEERFKASIAEDTSLRQTVLYLQGTEAGGYRFRIDFLDEAGNLTNSLFGCNNCKVYVDFSHAAKQYYKGKQFASTGYHQLLQALPLPAFALWGELEKSKMRQGSDGQYQFMGARTIRLRQDLTGYQATSVHFSNLGVQYERITVSASDSALPAINDVFNEALLLTSYKPYKKSDQPIAGISAKHIGQALPKSLQEMIRGADSSIQYYLVDLFYQSCLPCTESIPFLNELNSSAAPGTLKVIGVDPVPRDSLHMHQFVQRYHINYPVITGAAAIRIRHHIQNEGYPATLVMDRNGILRYYAAGALNEKKMKQLRALVHVPVE